MREAKKMNLKIREMYDERKKKAKKKAPVQRLGASWSFHRSGSPCAGRFGWHQAVPQQARKRAFLLLRCAKSAQPTLEADN